jgi:hypothetical protein
MNWKRNGPPLLLLAALGLLLAPGARAQAATRSPDRVQQLRDASGRAAAHADSFAALEAETDSLVWYVEHLEARVGLAEVRGRARADSLRVRLEYVTQQLQWANEDRRRWYQDPRLWFLMGCASATLVLSGAMHIAF